MYGALQSGISTRSFHIPFSCPSVPGLSCYLLTSATTSILLSLGTTGDGTSILAQDSDLGYDKMFIPRLFILLFIIVSFSRSRRVHPRKNGHLLSTRRLSRMEIHMELSLTFQASVLVGTISLHITWWMIPIGAAPLRERSELKERISREKDTAPTVKKDNFVSRQQEINKLRRRF